jgi:hypothetical protein
MAPFAGFNKNVVAGLGGLPVDTAENLINLGTTGTYATLNALTGRADSPPVLEGSFGGSKHLRGLLNQAGVQTENPNPDDRASRMLHTGGGMLMPGVGALPNAAAATGAAVASEIDPSLTALGAVTPAALGAGVNAARQAVTGPTRANLAMFRKAGVEPSVGMATGNKFFQGLENLLSKFPGATGILSKFRDDIQAGLGRTVKSGVSAEEAGRAIERGITGKGGFLEETSAQWKILDGKVAAKVKPGTTIMPSETVKALDELTAPVQGAEKTTGALANPRLAQMKEDLTADLAQNNGRISFEGLRALRTRVGSMLENSIVSGVPGGELKKLYASLSRDLEAAATAGGARSEFLRQQAYWAARMGRVERVLDRVVGNNKNPEDIFRAFMPKDPNQSSTALATIRSLPPGDRRIVSQAVVDRLGRATPGRQDEYGDLFSSKTFLTNWAKLSPKVKNTLFPDPKMRANLDAVAKAADNLSKGSEAFANPSGTAGSFAAYAIYGTMGTGLITGNLPAVAGAAGTMAAANITARLLTNQRFVNWLANGPSTKNPQAVAAHMARLTTIYNSTDDEALKADLDTYIQSMNGEQ